MANKSSVLAPGEMPSVEDLQNVVDDLLALHEANPRISVGRQKIMRLWLLHGLAEHTFNMLRCARQLWIADLRVGVAPLARVAFEHALVANWAHVHPDGLEGFASKADRESIKLLNGTIALPGVPEDLKDVLNQFGTDVQPPLPVRNFEETCRSFDPSGWLYAMYRLMSGGVHPGPRTVHDYAPESTNGKPFLLLSSPADDHEGEVAWAMALSAVLVSGIYEDIRKNKPNKVAVRTIAERVGMKPLVAPVTPKK